MMGREAFLVLVIQGMVFGLSRGPRPAGFFENQNYCSAKLSERNTIESAQLRFAYHVLGLEDATELVERIPEFVQMPVTTSLAPKHAALCGSAKKKELSLAEIEKMCYSPHSEKARAFASAFRRGGRYASKHGETEILEAMLMRGYHAPSDRDGRNASALHWAAACGHRDCVALLLEHLSPSDRDKNMATPLHWAAAGVEGNAFGVGARLETMIELLAADNTIANAETHDKVTPLHWAAWSGSMDAIRLLVRYGAHPSKTNIRGCTAAHWAAAGGHISVLRILRDEFGLDILLPNFAGHTPLAHAVAHHRSSVVNFYLGQNLCDQAAVEYALSVAAHIRSSHDVDDASAADLEKNRHRGTHREALRIATTLTKLPGAPPRI